MSSGDNNRNNGYDRDDTRWVKQESVAIALNSAQQHNQFLVESIKATYEFTFYLL